VGPGRDDDTGRDRARVDPGEEAIEMLDSSGITSMPVVAVAFSG
jgi:hypothetical protein